jgi:hypothetical protein
MVLVPSLRLLNIFFGFPDTRRVIICGLTGVFFAVATARRNPIRLVVVARAGFVVENFSPP